MKYESFELTMSDGCRNVVHCWMPESTPEAVIVISHGMAEHGLRYENFAEYACSNNCGVICEDHRGHGKTAEINGTGLGWVCSKGGFARSAADIHEELVYAKEKFPKAKIVLMGHSYGSFLSQYVIENYGDDMDCAILLGTAGPRNLLMFFGKNLARLIKFFHGSRYVSSFVNFLSFGPYNSRIKNRFSKAAWISSVDETVKKYDADPLCGFDCSVGFMYDLMDGFTIIHNKKNMKSIPKNLRVMVHSGSEDPVGDYGKTVKNLVEIYRKNGINVDFKLWDNARHELHNEFCRQEIYEKILQFINS